MERDIELQNIISQTDTEMQRVGWSTKQGRSHLIKTYNKRSRYQLNHDQLLEFLNHLKSLPTKEA